MIGLTAKIINYDPGYNEKEHKKIDIGRHDKEEHMSVGTINQNRSTVESCYAYAARNLWAGFLIGMGFVAFVDETVFHQLLHWHHFYDRSTTGLGLVWDGIFHAFSWVATIGASFMLADLNRRKAWWPARWAGGILLGAGIFQLYDGTIQHKWMRIHQIRYHVNIFPYDLVWDVTAAIMIVIGSILIIRTGRLKHRSDES